MASLQYSTLLLRKLTSRQLTLCQLAAFNQRCASAIQTSHKASLSTTNVTPNQEDSGRKSYYVRTAIGLGAGLLIGATLKIYYDNRCTEEGHSLNLLPSVHAASPFGLNSLISDENNVIGPSTPATSKRKSCNFIADVVDKVSNGVVCIEIQDRRRRYKSTRNISNGSGVIISNDGLIITNAHVVVNRPRRSKVKVRLQNGAEYEGSVEEIDTISDLALIRIKCNDLKPIPLGNSSDLRPGEFVAALGSPLSLSNTITVGVVSSVGRASQELGLLGRDIQYIQTDATITFGNSGGPLVNLDGELIGINSMTVMSGISFAIPIDYAKEFMAKAEKKRTELAKYPESPLCPIRRYLGVTMLTLTEAIIQELQARGTASNSLPADINHGIFIWRVVLGSPAHQAGLRPGDIITHINNHEASSVRDMYKALEGHEELKLIVIRAGQRYAVSVVPED